jgi:hypothetical protein
LQRSRRRRLLGHLLLVPLLVSGVHLLVRLLLGSGQGTPFFASELADVAEACVGVLLLNARAVLVQKVQEA